MLDTRDSTTSYSLKLLVDTISSAQKKSIIWVGAGVSKWCGYKLWEELSDDFHSIFLKYEKAYNKDLAINLRDNLKLPDFFQLCKDTNRELYFRKLKESFEPSSTTPVYKRFIETLNNIQPIRIITTNIDEQLEKSIPEATVIQRTDSEHASLLLNQDKSFIFKIHGSISSIETTIVTFSDYEELVKNQYFIQHLTTLINNSTIIFLGYSIRDEYILKLLKETNEINTIFGDGPHFAIMSSKHAYLPDSIKQILYIPKPHQDHRSSLQVIEEIAFNGKTKNRIEKSLIEKPTLQSAHLLFDIYPPGKWNTSHVLNTKDSSGKEKQVIIGAGYSDDELPGTISTAVHDLATGLICFDKVYAPISLVSHFHNILTSGLFLGTS